MVMKSSIIENRKQWQDWLANLESEKNRFVETRDEPEVYPCVGFYTEYEDHQSRILIFIEYCYLTDFVGHTA